MRLKPYIITITRGDMSYNYYLRATDSMSAKRDAWLMMRLGCGLSELELNNCSFSVKLQE